MFKVGQRVWTINYGWGVVSGITNSNEYCTVAVDFDNGQEDWYTSEGVRHEDDTHRSLFFKEIPIPKEALEPPFEWIELKIGDIVIFKPNKIAYVVANSSKEKDHFFYQNVIPTLETAFDSKLGNKSEIIKVVGNTRDN